MRPARNSARGRQGQVQENTAPTTSLESLVRHAAAGGRCRPADGECPARPRGRLHAGEGVFPSGLVPWIYLQEDTLTAWLGWRKFQMLSLTGVGFGFGAGGGHGPLPRRSGTASTP